jgi:predicted Zn finger-like uncharacterized protein
MILTCPKCATRYLVEDSEIRPEGRKVRCSTCGETWRVTAQSAAAESTLEALPKPTADSPAEAEREPGVETQDPEVSSLAEITAEAAAPPILETIRTEADEALIVAPINTQSRAAGQPKSNLAANLGLAIIVIAALVVAAFSFRAEIMRLVPATSGVYGALGLAGKPGPSMRASTAKILRAATVSTPDVGTHD